MNKTILNQIEIEIQKAISIPKDKTTHFFKTGKGSYGEHDQFLGIRNPDTRNIAKKYANIPFEILELLLYSPFNEKRLLALIILANQYPKSTPEDKIKIYNFYNQHLSQVNNWNLVDLSAPYTMGRHLLNQDPNKLFELSSSTNLWYRRIAIVSTWWFIRNNELNTTYQLADLLLQDSHDLIHKAVGWMLREAGKKDTSRLKQYLEQNATNMPRTMLRYSIEKFTKKEQAYYRGL